MATAQDGGKDVSPMHRPPLPPGNAPGTHLVSLHSVGGRPVHRLREDLCTGRPPTGVMIPDAV